MSWRTLLVLAALVAGLAWFATRTARDTDLSLAQADRVLFPGLEAGRVAAVRIENLMRDLHMRFERDGQGGWRLTDPVVARAEPGVIDLVVEVAVRARGPAVPASDLADLAKLGLEPPQFVLELETDEGAARSRRRVEVGAAEHDGLRVNVRSEGRVSRVSRELETVLMRELHEFRASTISDVDARRVVEVRRRGSVPSGAFGPAPDAAFDAVLEDGLWRATAPVEGLLDPTGMALYIQSIVAYRYESVFDEGERTLASLGLDPPELTLSFGTTGTEVVEVLLGRSGVQRSGGWLGTRRGSGIVWPLAAEEASFLATPVSDLFDHKLLRARRGSISTLEIDSTTASVRLERGAKGWTCAVARAGSAVFGPAEPAEARAVEDVLGALERYELAAFPPGVAFDPGLAPVRFRVQGTEGGASGEFGAPFHDAAGAVDVLFRRTGETAVAHGDPSLVSVLARDPELYLTLRFLEANEMDVGAIVVRGAGGERRFVRNSKGLWTRPGGSVEARELRPVLDSLLFLRASQPVPRESRRMLERAIEVELHGLDPSLGGTGGIRAVFSIGLAPVEGGTRAEIELSGRRGVAQDPRLHGALEALLAGD